MSRTKILCKQYNKVYNEARKDEQRFRKLSKLVGKKDTKENDFKKPKKKEMSNIENKVNPCTSEKSPKRKSVQESQIPKKRTKRNVQETSTKI